MKTLLEMSIDGLDIESSSSIAMQCNAIAPMMDMIWMQLLLKWLMCLERRYCIDLLCIICIIIIHDSIAAVEETTESKKTRRKSVHMSLTTFTCGFNVPSRQATNTYNAGVIRHPTNFRMRNMPGQMKEERACMSGKFQGEPESVKVVGMGSAGMDYLAEVASFPKPDDKMRTENLELQGGGNCGNALTAAARLGMLPTIVSKIGADSVGDAILAEFEADGVNTDYMLRSECGKSPFTYIIVDRETNTRTCIHTPGEAFSVDEMTSELIDVVLQDASAVYFDGRLAEAALLLAKEAKMRGIPVLVEAERLRPGLDELLGQADYIVTSAKFPREWTGKDSIDDAMVSIMDRLPDVSWIATTLGSKGALLLEQLDDSECHGDVACVERLDGSFAESLFNEAATLREVSGNTTTKSFVNIDSECQVQSRSIASSGPFKFSGTQHDEETRHKEERVAKEAAKVAAIMNADSANPEKYESSPCGAKKQRSEFLCLTAIESADIPLERIVDTTGAGDAFIGSMLFAIAAGMPPVKGAELGCLVAAVKCSSLGARPGLPYMRDITLQ